MSALANASENSTSTESTAKPVARPAILITATLLAIVAGVGVARVVRSHGVVASTGYLEAARVVLRSPMDSEVELISVAVGDSVKPGDAVATLKPRGLPSLESTRAELRSRQLQKENALARFEFEVSDRARQLDDDIHQLEMRIAELDGQRYAAEMERIAWRDALDGSQVQAVGYSASLLDQDRVVKVFDEVGSPALGLSETGRFHALISYEQSAAKAESCAQQIELCHARLGKLQERRKDLADQFRRTIGLDQIDEAIQAANDVLAASQTKTELASPAYGTVVASVEIGTRCDERTPVIELADNARRRITTQLPAATVATMQKGDIVALSFPTGDQRLGRVGLIAPLAADERGVSVVIEPTGKRWPRLSLGCEVTVEVR